MASPKKFLASAAVAAGLLGGGVVGVILGVPGVSGAQTTTVPESPNTTVAPDDGTTPDRPPRGDGENCPEKDGAEGTRPAPGSGTGTGTGTNLSLRQARGPGRA
jgi:hypothetical protein